VIACGLPLLALAHLAGATAGRSVRLSALVDLYIHPLKGIFHPSQRDSFLYTIFSRTHPTSISLLYSTWDPHVRFFFIFFPAFFRPLLSSLLPPSLFSLPLRPVAGRHGPCSEAGPRAPDGSLVGQFVKLAGGRGTPSPRPPPADLGA
jgi:hypothetical protein